MKLLLTVILLCFPFVSFANTPETFVKDYSGVSWAIIISLVVVVISLIKLIWWLSVKAFNDMKKTNHETVEELKTNNKEQVERLERSIDKLDKTIGKAFSRMNEFDAELGDMKDRVGKVEGICLERRNHSKGC